MGSSAQSQISRSLLDEPSLKRDLMSVPQSTERSGLVPGTRKTALKLGLAGVLGPIGGFTSNIIYARTIGPSGRGDLAAVLAAVAVSEVVLAFGLPDILTRHVTARFPSSGVGPGVGSGRGRSLPSARWTRGQFGALPRVLVGRGAAYGIDDPYGVDSGTCQGDPAWATGLSKDWHVGIARGHRKSWGSDCVITGRHPSIGLGSPVGPVLDGRGDSPYPHPLAIRRRWGFVPLELADCDRGNQALACLVGLVPELPA